MVPSEISISITGTMTKKRKWAEMYLPGSAAFAGRQHGKAGPAVLAGNHAGILEMIPGGFVHDDTFSSARGAGVPDNVSGSCAHDIEM
jgi:hypothetical protein